MSLLETVISVGLLVPLSTLSFRLFVDVVSFSKFINKRLHHIRAIQQVQRELSIHQFNENIMMDNEANFNAKVNVGDTPTVRSLVLDKDNLYVRLQQRGENLRESNRVNQMILLCTGVIKLVQGRSAPFLFTDVEFSDGKQVRMLH